ncbi:MAG: TerB family tellurite resistance protein [Pseudomonadales bacterium]|nr:TerB family tellurite resistance protein [Pseudomonadales bacterium]
MLDKIVKFFESSLQSETESSDAGTNKIEKATAAIFIELSKSDYFDHPEESILILNLLKETFELSDRDLAELVSLAESEAEDSHDLFQFTSLVNDHYNNSEKIKLLENCWRIAFADGRLDKYEEHFIRKIAGLINLPPSEFVKTKLRIRALTE